MYSLLPAWYDNIWHPSLLLYFLKKLDLFATRSTVDVLTPRIPLSTTEIHSLLDSPWDIQGLKHSSLLSERQTSLVILFLFAKFGSIITLPLKNRFPFLYFVKKKSLHPVEVLHLPSTTLSESPHLVCSFLFICREKEKSQILPDMLWPKGNAGNLRSYTPVSHMAAHTLGTGPCVHHSSR